MIEGDTDDNIDQNIVLYLIMPYGLKVLKPMNKRAKEKYYNK